MLIANFSKNDIASLKELQPPNWPDITASHQFYLSSDFCTTLKLVDNNKIIGVGTSIIHDDVAWLAQIIIHPDWRNKGLGKLITEALIEQLTKYKTIYLIATELGEPVYTKLNFKIETEYIFFRRNEINSIHVDNKYIVSFDESYRNKIYELDGFVSGENRINHLQNFITNSVLYINKNILEGCYLPSFGDGLIIANNSTAGIALMENRIQTKQEACIPIDNKIAIEFVKTNSFNEYRRAKRMYLGEKLNFKPEYVYNRVSGQIG